MDDAWEDWSSDNISDAATSLGITRPTLYNMIEKYNQKPPGKHHQHAVMAAMIESVDEGVGRLVKRLDELSLTDSTAIVFFSDNGGYGPATSMHPLKGYKGTYYEGGIREPFFVKWPAMVQPGTRCDTPIIGVDLFPTFCEMTGAQLPNQPLDGISLIPLLRGESLKSSRALYWHFPAYLQSYQRSNEQRDPLFRSRPCSVIREGDYKLHQYFEDGEDGFELYNLKNDIGESRNLIADEPEVAKRLRAKLGQWQSDIAAPIPRELNPRYDAQAEAAARKAALSRPSGTKQGTKSRRRKQRNKS